MPRLISLVGKRFGRLVVTKRSEQVGSQGQPYWWCHCDCGSDVQVRGQSLRIGRTQSCGCLARLTTTQRNHRHGNAARGKQSPEYIVWNSLKTRCLNPKSSSYVHYGGRGITVCPEWRDSFEAFLRDVGPRPEGHTLDRIDTNGNYEPGNCRWATQEEQANNRRADAQVLVNGHIISLVDLPVYLKWKKVGDLYVFPS
jgi:hypothetical protein